MNRGARPSRAWLCAAGLVVAGLSVACSTNIDLGGGGDAGLDSGTCPSFIMPDANASCGACDKGSFNCQYNGCFGGYVCDAVEQDCKAPGTPCSPDSGTDSSQP